MDHEAVQVAACETVVWLEDRLFVTAHLFFGDGDERPVAEVRHGSLWFFDRAAEARREAIIKKKRRTAAVALGGGRWS